MWHPSRNPVDKRVPPRNRRPGSAGQFETEQPSTPSRIRDLDNQVSQRTTPDNRPASTGLVHPRTHRLLSPSSEYSTEEGSGKDQLVRNRMREIVQELPTAGMPPLNPLAHQPQFAPRPMSTPGIYSNQFGLANGPAQFEGPSVLETSRIQHSIPLIESAQQRVRQLLADSFRRDTEELYQLRRASSLPPQDREVSNPQPPRPGSAAMSSEMTQELRAVLNQVRLSGVGADQPIVNLTDTEQKPDQRSVFPNLYLPDGYNTQLSTLMAAQGIPAS